MPPESKMCFWGGATVAGVVVVLELGADIV